MKTTKQELEAELRRSFPQFYWHRKPAGYAGYSCPICGCHAKRLRVLHRALTAEEQWCRRNRGEGLSRWVTSTETIR